MAITIPTDDDIKNNAWVTVNEDFLVTSRVICQWFSLAKHLTSDQKSLFTVTNVLFYFLHAILYLEHTVPLQTIIAHFAIVVRDGLFWLDIVTSSQLICDVTRTRGTGIVT